VPLLISAILREALNALTVTNRPASQGSARLGSDPYLSVLAVLVTLYVALFTAQAWDLHAAMRTHRSDLGQIDQSIWNSSRGRFLAQTDNGYEATRLTDHVEPMLVLISPLYWLWDDVRALLFLQVAMVAIGAFPLYFLSLRRFAVLLTPQERRQIWRSEPVQQWTRPLALGLSLAYLLAPHLQSAVLTEFHAAPLATPLILWAFWAVDAQRWGQLAVAALLIALVKEEIALLAAGLGAWAAWRAWWDTRQEAKQGAHNGHPDDRDVRAAHGLEETSPARPREARPRPVPSGQRPRPDAPPPPSTLHKDALHPLYGQQSTVDSSPRSEPVSGLLRSRRTGLLSGVAILLLALLWFYLATFVVVPAHALQVYGVEESTYFQRYGALGNSPADILKSILTRPDLVWQIASEPARVAYLVGFLVIFAFFPLLGGEILLLSLPVLLANLLSAYPAQYYGEFHYSAPLVPYFAVAAAYGLGRLWRWLAHRLDHASPAFQHLPAADSGTMAVAAMAQNARTALMPLVTLGLVVWMLAWAGANSLLHGRTPLAGRYDPAPIAAHHRLLDRFVAQLPDDAAVAATAAVHPHVSHRRYVYQFPLGLDAPVPADWALLDVTTNTDMAPGDLKAQVDAMLAGEWGVVDAADGFLLLARGAPAKTIPATFYSFARPSQGADSLSASPLQLADLRADDWSRWRQTQFVVDWQVGEGFDAQAAAPWLEIVTPQQEVIATLNTAAPPALVWYPPERWQPGDTVRVTTLPLSLPPVVGVRVAGAAGQPAAIFQRNADGELVHLPPTWATAAVPDAAAAGFSPLRSTASQVVLPEGTAHAVAAAIADRAYQPGDAVDLWLQWEMQRWPENLAAFVHLRRNGETVAQADGPPGFFGQALSVQTGGRSFVNDWRQVTIPAGAAAGGDWALAVGLYDPQTGERMTLGAGNELLIGPIAVEAASAPDQACALIAATCASQPP